MDEAAGWASIAGWFADCELVAKPLCETPARGRRHPSSYGASPGSAISSAPTRRLPRSARRRRPRPRLSVLFARGTAIDALRANGAKNLGIVRSISRKAEAASESAEDQGAAAQGIERCHLQPAGIWAAFQKPVPRRAHRRAATLPASRVLSATWSRSPARSDWLGINYYAGGLYKAQPPGTTSARQERPAACRSDLAWKSTPKGLTDLLVRVNRDYTGPLCVTETGAERRRGHPPRRFLRSAPARRRVPQTQSAKCNYVQSCKPSYEWAEGYLALRHVDRRRFLERPQKRGLSRVPELHNTLRRAAVTAHKEHQLHHQRHQPPPCSPAAGSPWRDRRR